MNMQGYFYMISVRLYNIFTIFIKIIVEIGQ